MLTLENKVQRGELAHELPPLRRIASSKTCLCNIFKCHTVQRIVMGSVQRPAFPSPLQQQKVVDVAQTETDFR
jgi:hypothetical protein